MSKQETIEALRRSAMVHFATHGYQAASLREIARGAGVPLSAVHNYFGNKSDLYSEVSRLAWEDIEAERLAIFYAAGAAASSARATMADLVRAIAFPIVRRAISDDPVDLAWVWIVRGGVWQLGCPSTPQMVGNPREAIGRWIDEVAARLPGCTYTDAVWAYSYVVGTIYSWQVIDRLYDGYLEGAPSSEPEDITRDIIDFCCAGVDAMIARRQKPRIRAV